jgi:hypothetical protein
MISIESVIPIDGGGDESRLNNWIIRLVTHQDVESGNYSVKR